jgi:MSHA biogenesis protein MshO
MPCSRRNRGFTLVELVIVIVLMSIVSLAGVEIIRQSSKIYLKQNNRKGLSGSARLAVERLSREFRNALPGSVRVSGDCLEYLPIRVAGTYFSVPIGTPQTSMTVAAVSTDLAGESGRVAIYSVGANPYDETSDILSPVATIGAPDGDSISTISWSGLHDFAFESPTRRFYLVGDPISYCLDGEYLFRYSNYTMTTAQPVVADLPASLPNRALLVNKVSGSALPFTVADPGLSRNAIVMLAFDFSTGGETIQVTHEVQLRNVP